MKNNKIKKWLIKSVVFTLIIDSLCLLVMWLQAENKIKDATSIAALLSIFVISAICFGFVKGDTEHPFLYDLSVFATHSFVIVLRIVSFDLIYFRQSKDLENIEVLWSELFVTIFFAAILIFDIVFHLLRSLLLNKRK